MGVLLMLVTAVSSAGAAAFEGSPFGPVVASVFDAADKDDTSKGNQLAIIGGGYDALLLRVHLIRQAKTSIAVQTFIWTNDECGRLLMFELIEAARRGVKVRIIADHMFSDQDAATVAFLATAHPNLELKHYRPAMSRMKPSFVHTMLATVQSFRKVNQRMHNKVMLFDDAILITGGRNVENSYYDHSTGMNFRDRDVLAVGPVARDAAESFAEFWGYRYAVASRDLTDVASAIAGNSFRRYSTRADYDFGGLFSALEKEADDAGEIAARFVSRLKPARKVTFLCDEPGKSSRSRTARITRELRGTLEKAQTSVVMQTPYLVLSPTARDLFRDMHRQHPAMRIKVSSNSFGSTDNVLAYSANYRLRNEYVEDLRLEVHEFKPEPAALPVLFPQYPAMVRLAKSRAGAGKPERLPFLCLHAKSLVVDDQIAFIGSYNLDPRSERLNTEVGLLVEDEVIARVLREEIERDMRPENSWVIGRRSMPLGLDAVNGMVDGITSLGPVDLWPIQNTSSFELRAGGREVPPDHADFHRNYREVGSFPGADGVISTKEILTRIYKAVGAPLTPVL
ncbi:MAG TPA: phospholipase D family protein [Opitutaceae bacterium]|nr:phospholipase D family protein [Opitutaceae bacterium]